MNASLCLAASTLVILAACDGPPEPDAPVRVFAASSLIDAFEALARELEASAPGVAVEPSFAGSQALRLQIEGGAPADVFASADARHMDALVSAGYVEGERVFAYNELVVIVPVGSTLVRTFADLPNAERIVIGDENVPAGRYARRVLARAGQDFAQRVLARVVSEESSVRLARAKVELGEADAAIVYRSDAFTTERVRVIEIPEDANVRADYHIGLVASSPRRGGAERWVEWVTGDEGRRTLASFGLTPAP